MSRVLPSILTGRKNKQSNNSNDAGSNSSPEKGKSVLGRSSRSSSNAALVNGVSDASLVDGLPSGGAMAARSSPSPPLAMAASSNGARMGATLSPQRGSVVISSSSNNGDPPIVMRRHPSSGEIRSGVAHDGTPVVYDETSTGAMAGNGGLVTDDRMLSRSTSVLVPVTSSRLSSDVAGSGISSSNKYNVNRRSTLSVQSVSSSINDHHEYDDHRRYPDGRAASRMPRSASASATASASRIVGEGSLSLEHLLPANAIGSSSSDGRVGQDNPEVYTNNGSNVRMGPGGQVRFTDANGVPSDSRLFVVPSPSNEGEMENVDPYGRQQQQQQGSRYPPVFEMSDVGTSDSSEASSPAVGMGSGTANASSKGYFAAGQQQQQQQQQQPTIQIVKTPSAEELPLPRPNQGGNGEGSDRFDPEAKPVHRNGASLTASSSTNRGRSASTSSLVSNSSQGQTSSTVAAAGSTGGPASVPRTRKSSAKKDKVGKGIAGALAYSGVALAAPGPGLAQPFQPKLTSRASSESQQASSASQNASIAPSIHQNQINDNVPYDRQQSLSPQLGSLPSPPVTAMQGGQQAMGPTAPALVSRSSEEHSGYDSPTPLSQYTPNDSPKYEQDSYQALVSIEALGDFDDVMSQLGTGYALASSKRNADFHAIFKNIPEDDFLIEDYGCALQREILIQGRLYISEHHLCFNANIFGWVTTVILAFNEIIAIEKRNTALVIPNAIHIATMHSRQTFASFISRDMTYELITSLWRNQHPVMPRLSNLRDAGMAMTTDDDEDLGPSQIDDASDAPLDGSSTTTGAATGTKKKGVAGLKKRKRDRLMSKRSKGATSSAPDLLETENEQMLDGAITDEPADGDAAGEQQRQPGSATTARMANKGGPRPSLGASQLTSRKVPTIHPPTTCNCGTPQGCGPHFTNVVMDSTYPGSPEKLYNLMFTSGFMKEFLTRDMKNTELQIGDWAPQKTGSHLLTRSYNYIKPLSAPVGPKSAKCILVDENLHVDFDNFVVTLTTTRTPEVPSGGSFAVKTKTCFMWAKNNSTRVLVTSAVEWTGRSFLKSIVDKSSLDGQKTLYVALEKAMRGYINQHKSEFLEGGEELSGLAGEGSGSGNGASSSSDGIGTGSGGGGGGGDSADGSGALGVKDADDAIGGAGGPDRELVAGASTGVNTNQKDPLAFVSNTVPALRPLCDFLNTLWDTLADFLGQMSLTALVCSAIILFLVISNAFTLLSLRKKSSRYIPSRRPPPDYSSTMHSTLSTLQQQQQQQQPYYLGAGSGSSHDSEVAQAVRGVLREYFSSLATAPASSNDVHRSPRGDDRDPFSGSSHDSSEEDHHGGGGTKKEEIEQMRSLLAQLESRVERLKTSLADLD